MIPIPITSLSYEQEFEFLKLSAAVDNMPADAMRSALKDLIRQNYIYKNNVANLTKYIAKSGL